MRDYWKYILNKKITNVIKNNKDKNIIFIGLNTYHRNHRTKVKINTNNIFYIKVSARTYARNTIEYNIDKYRKNIINGTFPIKYIDHNFLIKQYNKLSKIYGNMKYKKKTFSHMTKWINLKLGKNIHTDGRQIFGGEIFGGEVLYVCTEKEYDNYIKIDNSRRRNQKKIKELLGMYTKKYINGYTMKWLSLLSAIPNINHKIKKGYIHKKNKTIPYVEERYEGALDELNQSCFLYTVKKDIFKDKLSSYKYKSIHTVDILSKKYIYNIYNELIKDSVRIIKYNN